MILCSNECIPCCDFCLFSIHEEWDKDGEHIVGGLIGCKRHFDKYHQDIAESCGSCKDYICYRVVGELMCQECGEKIDSLSDKCPICGYTAYMPYDECRANLAREEWKNTYKWRCIECGKWYWDISGPDYKCECGSTLFEDKVGESV